MMVFPEILQSYITFITCKPYTGQEATTHSNFYQLASSIIIIFTGMLLSYLILKNNMNWAYFIFPWIITTYGMRKLQVMIVHQCAHGNFNYKSSSETTIGRLISSVFFIENYYDYKFSHLYRHHSVNHLMGDKDPTYSFLINILKLNPEKSTKANIVKVYLSLFNPFYHYRCMKSRVASYWNTTHDPSLKGNIFQLITLLTTATLIYLGYSIELLFVYCIPAVILFNYSSALRLAVEHVFTDLNSISLKNYDDKSRVIFLGDELKNSTPLAITMFVLRFIFIHQLSRLFILVGDTPCHDYHHVMPYEKNWANYLYTRDKFVNKSPQKQYVCWININETWGYHNALIESISSLKKIAGGFDYEVASLGRHNAIDDL